MDQQRDQSIVFKTNSEDIARDKYDEMTDEFPPKDPSEFQLFPYNGGYNLCYVTVLELEVVELDEYGDEIEWLCIDSYSAIKRPS